MKKKQLLLTALAAATVPAMAIIANNRNALGNAPVIKESFQQPPSADDQKAADAARADSIAQAEKMARGKTHMPQKSAPDGVELPPITASVYDFASNTIGMYRLPEVSGSEMEKVSDISSYYGGALNGELYYACHDGRYEEYWDTDNDPHGHKIQAYNINTWQPVGNELTLPTYRATDLAINPVDGLGYAFCDYGAMSFHLYSINLQTGEQTDLTPDVNLFSTENVRALAFDSNGILFGVNAEGDFGTIDMTTGKVVKRSNISSLNNSLQYGWSGTFDPDSGNFLLMYTGSPNYGSTIETRLYSIKPDTGEYTLLAEWNGKCITSIFVSPEKVAAGAPGVVSDISGVFENGSLQGKLKFTMPSVLNDGSNATGSATWKIYEGKEVLASGEATYGSEVNADLTMTSVGKHTLMVTASNAAGEGKKTRYSMWIGPDRPIAPQNVKVDFDEDNNKFSLTWDAVTEGANGGYVNPSEITYTVVRIPGDVTVAENIAATSYTDIYEPSGIESIIYKVTAKQGDAVSDEALSTPVITGYMELPYDLNGGDIYGLLDNWTIIDANQDGNTWDSDSYYKIYYSYSSSQAADDWAITPPIKALAGCKYNVHAVFKSLSSSFPEKIEVKYGDAPTAEAMTKTALPETVIDNTSGQTFDFTVIPDNNGKLFIGFHAISDANMFKLNIIELTISAPVNEAAPAKPIISEVTADSQGALKAQGKVLVPTQAENGTTLSNITKVEILRNGVAVKSIDNPAPGSTVEFEDSGLSEAAECSYVAYAYNGNLKSAPSDEYKTFVGINRPGELKNIRISRNSDDATKVTVTWDAPDTDWLGYPLNGSVTYKVEAYPDNAYYHGNKTYEGIAQTSFEFVPTFDTGRDHGFVYVKVNAVNSAGAGYANKSSNIYAGNALSVPFKESFPNYSLEHPWGDGESNGPQIASITDDERSLMYQQYNGWNRLMDSSMPSSRGSQDNDNGFAGMFGWSYVEDEQGNYHNEYTELLSPAINLTGLDHPMLSFYTFNWYQYGFSNPNELDVDVITADGTRHNALHLVIGELGKVEDWEHVAVDLGQYAGQTVTLVFKGTIHAIGENGYNWVLIDNIRVDQLASTDLSIADIEAPVQAKPNEEFTVKARISNLGASSVASHKAVLYHNGVEVATKELGTLDFSRSEVVEFKHALSVKDPIGNAMKIEVVADGDAKVENNTTSEVTVARNLQLLPEPEQVYINPGGERLEWKEPDMTSAVPEALTEDFESYPVAEQEKFLTEAGEWIFVDKDQKPIGGMISSSTWEMIEFPGIPTHSAQSWWIQSRLFDEFSDSYYGYDNSLQYLANMYVVNDTFTAGEHQDDWAISPELCGKEQLITLWARSYNRETPETVEFLYSEGGTDTESFNLVRRIETLPGDWTQYAIVVPEGARRFAIRGCSYAPMGTAQIFIDNVSFYPAKGAPQQLDLKGYNIYCDNALINQAPVAGLEYLELPEGNHEYAVSAVYAGGESRAVKAEEGSGISLDNASRLRIMTTDGKIMIDGLEGKHYSVVSASGIIIGSGSGVDNVEIVANPGIYVVKAANRILKVVVK